LTAGLLSGRVDFIVGALRPAAGDAFEDRVLIEDRVALIARRGHPLAGRRHVTDADLAGYPWVLSRAGTPLRESLEAFFHARDVPPPQPAVETGDLALLRGLLVESDMLTVLSAHQLHHEIATGQLAVLRYDMAGLERRIGLITRRGAHLSPGANALLGEIDACAERWR
jgi:LysR family transcriptional regulator of gallate degradation